MKPEELDSMMMKIRKVMDDYNDFELSVPSGTASFSFKIILIAKASIMGLFHEGF